MVSAQILKAPFPYFGGKSRIADEIWTRLGDVDNFVDPFMGSLAVPLSRTEPRGVETFNDLDGWLCNFWRALARDPEGVASFADYYVSELDLHARGDWLFYRDGAGEFVERMRSDADFYCVKSAGWWVWGACNWIGGGWGPRQMPHLGNAGRGVNRQMPHLGDAGQGVNRQMPHLGNAGRGVNRKMPHLGNAGQEEFTTRGSHIRSYFGALSERFRDARIMCGDWARALSESITTRHGLTAVLLDPPYGAGNMDYVAGGNTTDVAIQVRDWAVANASRDMRVAYCGYEGIAEFPPEWECLAWKTAGGYGSKGDDENANSRRERIWFSPSCLKPENVQQKLFDGAA